MFNQKKQVNTIKVHPSSITSALRLLNPPNQLQDDTKAKAIQRPRTTQDLPKWRPSVILKAFLYASLYEQRVRQDPIRPPYI